MISQDLVEIDGSYGEAGGQIVRTAASLAAVTQKPCRIFNIRQGRDNPGLANQHLFGLRALSRLCQGKLEGDFLGSQEIKFFPGEIASQNLSLKIETAASIALILQTLILPSLFARKPVKIVFDGGATDTFFSPCFDYFRFVFVKILEKMGAKIDFNVIERGYYPEGKARVEVIIYPLEKGLKSLVLEERGKFQKILALSGASSLLKEKKVAERQLAGAKEVLEKLKLPLEEKIEYYETRCPGSQICLIAEYENTVIGADSLGRLGKRAEDVGKEAAMKLLKEDRAGAEACLDRHAGDQILAYLALADKNSRATVSEQTLHFKTNAWVIEKFLPGKFVIEEQTLSWKKF